MATDCPGAPAPAPRNRRGLFCRALILLFGSRLCQAAWIVGGLAILLLVFGNHPDTGYHRDRSDALRLAVLAAALLAFGIARARTYLSVLQNGTIVSARVVSAQEDRGAGDETEYRVTFEYRDHSGAAHEIRLHRFSNDLIPGEHVPVMIGRNGGAAVMERDFPGGFTLANLYGFEAAPLMCIVRLLAIPALSLVPLIGLLPAVSTFVEQATAALGHPTLYWCTVAAQFLWFGTNAKRFVCGTPNVSRCECGVTGRQWSNAAP